MHWKLELALLSCALLGLRHGFDYDHLAAITDIAAVQKSWKDSMRLGLLYATGHALTVIALGVVVVLLRVALPARLDGWTERLIGITLIALGIAVAASLIRKPADHDNPMPLRSRWTLLIGGVRYAWWWVARRYRAGLEKPASFAFNYNGPSIFAIGVLHGVGAETPSQLMLFLLAASLGGPSRGFLGLLAFGAGLVTMNAIMMACLGGVFRRSTRASSRSASAQRWIVALGAVYSLAIGAIFVAGSSAKLPPL
jgi:high-affinity nickel-transport protein